LRNLVNSATDTQTDLSERLKALAPTFDKGNNDNNIYCKIQYLMYVCPTKTDRMMEDAQCTLCG